MSKTAPKPAPSSDVQTPAPDAAAPDLINQDQQAAPAGVEQPPADNPSPPDIQQPPADNPQPPDVQAPPTVFGRALIDLPIVGAKCGEFGHLPAELAAQLEADGQFDPNARPSDAEA